MSSYLQLAVSFAYLILTAKADIKEQQEIRLLCGANITINMMIFPICRKNYMIKETLMLLVSMNYNSNLLR